MEGQIIPGYWRCEDLLKAFGIREAPQVHMNTAEGMTVAWGAALFFSDNFERSRVFLSEEGYIPTMLSNSRLTRQLHGIPEDVWVALVDLGAKGCKLTIGEFLLAPSARKDMRKRVEPPGNQIPALFPPIIHAGPAKGFEVKVILGVLAFADQGL